MKNTKGTSKSLFVNALIAAALTGLFLLVNIRTGRSLVLLLADGLTISGVILQIFTFLRWGLRKGYFSWLEYGFYIGRFLLQRKKDEEFLGFYDFESSQKYNASPLWTGCVVGGCCLAAGMIIMYFAAVSLL